MRVIAQRTLRRFWKRHAEAERPLRAWHQDAITARWSSPGDIKARYANASIINAERAVFNIHGNDYRLVAAVNYDLQIVFIKFVGTHAEYDRVDAATVEP
jgi:mRNA interferase HigB